LAPAAVMPGMALVPVYDITQMNNGDLVENLVIEELA
jgi:hypothetical protein